MIILNRDVWLPLAALLMHVRLDTHAILKPTVVRLSVLWCAPLQQANAPRTRDGHLAQAQPASRLHALTTTLPESVRKTAGVDANASRASLVLLVEPASHNQVARVWWAK